MILDKPYANMPARMKIDLQLFAGKKRDKLGGLSAEDLKSLKDELENDSDDDEDDEDYDPEDDDSDEDDDDQDDDDGDDDVEDIDEDPDANDDGDDDSDEDDDDDTDDEDDEAEDDEDDDTATGKSKKSGSGTKKPDKDKKVSAIIALKAENRELKARVDALERSQRDKEYESEEDKLAARFEAELIEDGMDEEKARKRARQMAQDKMESRKALDRDIDIQVERLEEKGYTDIRSKLSILKPIVEKSGLTLEEAYRAKYGAPKGKAAKTKDEQLKLLNKKKEAKKVATATGTTKTPDKDNVTLSKRDERIFKEWRRREPKLTRKEFLAILNDFDE